MSRRFILLLAVPPPCYGLPRYNPVGAGQVAVSTCDGRPCLKRDGRAWRPKGLVVEGIDTAPKSWHLLTQNFRAINQRFSVETLVAVKRFGADAVRLNVAPVNLDPQSSIYAPAYLPRIVKYVRCARSLGLVVFLQLNDQEPPNTGRVGVPSAQTVRVWQQIAPLFIQDQGVMFGAYNEPSISGDNEVDLTSWRALYQMVVDAIRETGARNVIGIDAPYFAADLRVEALAHLIEDDNVFYAVHPFPVGAMSFDNAPGGWPRLFMDFCAPTNGVLCQFTAWNLYYIQANIQACPYASDIEHQLAMPQISQHLFDVAKTLNAGIFGWAFDYFAGDKGIIMDASAPLTKTVGFGEWSGCHTTPLPWGGGELLHTNFADPGWQ